MQYTPHTNLQLTIRGLDQRTKDALMKKANQQGVSLNRYALKTLQHGIGADDSDSRYRTMKQFLDVHHADTADKAAFDDAIAWSDKTSIEKQRQEEKVREKQ